MLDFEVSTIIGASVIYVGFVGIFWYLPSAIGAMGYDLWTKLIISVLLLPICFFIVKSINEGG